MQINIKDKEPDLYIFNKHFLVNKFYIQIYLEKKNAMINQKKSYIFLPFKYKKFKNFYFSKQLNYYKKNLFIYCGFSYAKVFMKVGLGFRKKYNRKNSIMFLNVVRRKIVVFKPPLNSFFLMVKRRSLYVFASTKRKLFHYIVKFKSMRKETIYKYKGIFTNVRVRMYKRLTKSILFARRIKIKKIKLKLNKKQKLKK